MLWISISIRTAQKLNKVTESVTTSYETITDADSAIRRLELTKVSDKPTSIVQKRASIVNVDKNGSNDGIDFILPKTPWKEKNKQTKCTHRKPMRNRNFANFVNKILL